MPTVQEIIDLLAEYNPEAKLQVVVNNYPQPFKIAFGSSEGVSKTNCENVSLDVGGDHEREQ